MNSENEKAVRTLFEQWWDDNCDHKPIFDYGYETIGQDIAFHAFKAALQSQVSNTQQDGPNIQSLNICPRNSGHPHMFSKPGTIDSCRHCGLSEREWKVKAEAKLLAAQTPQREQSGEAVNWQSMFERESSGPNPYYKCKICGETEPGLPEYLEAHVNKHTSPTATASQESAPGQEAVAVSTQEPDLIRKLRGLAAMVESQEGWRPTVVDEAIAALSAPPTSTAIAAMVIRQAANICDRFDAEIKYPSECAAAIRNLTPTNAEAELEALMMKVALTIKESSKHGSYWFDDDLRAIVRRVLDEKGE